MNRVTSPAMLLVPEEAMGGMLTLFLILGGLCLIAGAKKTASGLIVLAIFTPFVMAVMQATFSELFAALPAETVQPVSWLLMGFVGVSALGALMALLVGKSAWDEAKGHILAEIILGIFRLIFSWRFIVAGSVLILFLWLFAIFHTLMSSVI